MNLFKALAYSSCLLALSGIASAQPRPAGPAAPQSFPKADTAAVAQHLSNAKALAGSDMQDAYAHRCVFNQVYPERTRAIQQYMLIEPRKVFDNLYFVGHQGVSAWVVATSQGLVLFDALDNPDEAKAVIVGGMERLGLDPKQIKYVVITHAHGDHFGGSTFFKATYGSRLLASKVDWNTMSEAKTNPSRRVGPAEWIALTPDHDMDITEGQKFTVGDTTFNFYVTPGHTPGTVSTIFKTTDRGAPHVVGFYGGGGLPQSIEAQRQQIASLGRFAELAKAAGADTLIANHQTQDGSLLKLEELKYRLPGAAHPYVIGRDAFARYFAVQQECARVQLAREGVK
jgi:metallo-beta-lactamase class B